MTHTVKVIGAGSIGNHLTHGCRSFGMEVTLTDRDPAALERAREEIYPARYGAWDSQITLALSEEVENERFDLVIIGTPPSTHLSVASRELDQNPSIILIEKPLAQPDRALIDVFVERAQSSPTNVLVGYNQRFKKNTLHFLDIAHSRASGPLTGLTSHMLESWDGILKAHFWMKSERDSYLAYTDQGGGALLEHSHALNLFLYFADRFGQGAAQTVTSDIEWVAHETGRYDRDSRLKIELESGLVGEVRQDLHTWPAKKEAIAQFGDEEFVWTMGESADSATHRRIDGTLIEHWDFPKTRPDDFRGELEHINHLLTSQERESPLSLREGVKVMDVALAAFESSETGTPVYIRNTP